ncbi:EAL domain-containing protein [Sinimarinibacterium sp. CAU 1509]|uniref:EAL domain-containing protein n=1 Tax=Sinimarinibacterium sp. CAU 1509 TaxID=2562283 RepID=UPI0010ACFCD2|nr:EAL domain-containing protein [Sinimarinibacterium sp. CAU 1509]TJY60907.1 EAL domain-containing protein [Sinimarinibacterium sp. CAU 1509]
MSGPRTTDVSPAALYRPGYRNTLHLKIAGILLVVAVAAAAAIVVGYRLLVQQPLAGSQRQFQQEAALRIRQQLVAQLRHTETVAALIGASAFSQNDPAASSPNPGELLSIIGDRQYAGVGIWPQPRSADAARRSAYWIVPASGEIQLRHDYNDRRVAPYDHERWYTPAPYAQRGHCAWTEAYRHPLAQREVVSCAMAIYAQDHLVGVVTIDLPLTALAQPLGPADSGAYAVLLSADNQILAADATFGGISSSKGEIRNLAALAQRDDRYNPLALAMHRQRETWLENLRASSLYSSDAIDRLESGTRALARAESESILAQLWLPQLPGAETDAGHWMTLDSDPIIGGRAEITLLSVPGTAWRLLRIESAAQGVNSIERAFARGTAIIAATLLLALLLTYGALRFVVVRPLRRINSEVSRGTHALEEALLLTLDESRRDEFGALAHHYNERSRQLRELSARSAGSQRSGGNNANAGDSTEQRVMRRTASIQTARLSAMIEASDKPTIVCNADGTVELINDAASPLLQCNARQALGRSLDDVLLLRIFGDPVTELIGRLAGQARALDYRDGMEAMTDHGPVPIHLRLVPVTSDNHQLDGAILVIEPRVATLEAPAQGSSNVARLTGLPGRTALERQLRSLLDTATVAHRSHALLLIDVDRLKDLNERSGRSAGDDVLIHIGERLTSETQRIGSLYHTGSDQFAVVVENINSEDACRYADELRQAIAAHAIQIEDEEFIATASIGVTLFSDPIDTPVDVIRRAEAACMRAKSDGRNRTVLHDAAMVVQPAAATDAVWVRRIHDGLERDLFHLATQYLHPTTPPAHGGGALFELLLTLEDEEGFWNETDAYRGAAERHHLIAKIDRWMLKALFKCLGQYPDRVQQCDGIVVHLSASSLTDRQLLDHLVDLFSKQPEVPPPLLCFEIDERTMTEHAQAAIAFSEAARAIGCKLCVGHFQASRLADLSLLRRIPADCVRIDASEFLQLQSDAIEQTVAGARIKLARDLRRQVIVNNVDSPWQRAVWTRLGADYLQGTDIARSTPMVFDVTEAKH